MIDLQKERLNKITKKVDDLFIRLYETIISLYGEGASSISVQIIFNLAEKGYIAEKDTKEYAKWLLSQRKPKKNISIYDGKEFREQALKSRRRYP